MALGAGLAFLMAVSLTGCEMDRMDHIVPPERG